MATLADHRCAASLVSMFGRMHARMMLDQVCDCSCCVHVISRLQSCVCRAQPAHHECIATILHYGGSRVTFDLCQPDVLPHTTHRAPTHNVSTCGYSSGSGGHHCETTSTGCMWKRWWIACISRPRGLFVSMLTKLARIGDGRNERQATACASAADRRGRLCRSAPICTYACASVVSCCREL